MGGSAELGEEAPASFAVVGRVPQGGAAGVPLTASIEVTFTPVGPLTPGIPYAVALSPDIRGMNGRALGPVPIWGFKTAGTPPPPPDTGKATPGLHPRPR